MRAAHITNKFYNPCSLEANWWAFCLCGGISIVFALSLVLSRNTTVHMTVGFGIYMIIHGLIYVISGINRARRRRYWGGLVLGGVIGILIGLMDLTLPYIILVSYETLLREMLIIWALTTGGLMLVSADRMHQEISCGIFMTACAVIVLLSVLTVLVMLFGYDFKPFKLSVPLIGCYFFVFGIMQLVMAYRLLLNGHHFKSCSSRNFKKY